jgi:hypothetical protein
MAKLDVTKLHKGQFIPVGRLEKLMQVDSGTTAYDARFMLLKMQVEGDSNKLGRPLLCRRENLGMKIMTDEEALSYKQKQHRQTVRRLDRIQDEIYRIDKRYLSNEHSRALTAEKKLQAAIINAIGQAAIAFQEKPQKLRKAG